MSYIRISNLKTIFRGGLGGEKMKKNGKKIVHVVGTGTIGAPLIVLLCRMKEKIGIDEVTFHKRRPLIDNRPTINNLVAKGAMLCVNEDVWGEFEKFTQTIITF